MKALIIVDMCRGFVDERTKDGKCKLYMPAAKALIPEINKLMRTMDKDEWFVVHMNDSHEKGDPEFAEYGEHCLYGTLESLTADGFDYERLQSYELLKSSFSVLRGTALQNLLRLKEAKLVVLVGVATEFCIFESAKDLAKAGYDVQIYRDCVAPSNPERGNQALRILQSQFSVGVIG
jgi:nicotinamidase/pyrazinamidase